MPKLVPAILEQDQSEIFRKIQLLEDFGHEGRVQIDFCDGSFVESKTVAVEELEKLPGGFEYEAHFMEELLPSWATVKEAGFSMAIVHWEIFASADAVADAKMEIEEAGLVPGLAVSPETDLEEVMADIEGWGQVTVLSVKPGLQGQEFIPDALERVARIREVYPGLAIEIDGGVRHENIGLIKNSGVDLVCAGSSIFAATDPAAAYRSLSK